MRNEVKIKFDMSGLKELQKQLKTANKTEVKVGILGNNNSRNDENTNASIGLLHEFGSIIKNIPQRSFLRMPLIERLTIEKIKSSGIQKHILENKTSLFFKKLGVLAENIIQEAFDTGGFGKWRPLSAITIIKKGTNRILIMTQQLRKAITSKVINK